LRRLAVMRAVLLLLLFRVAIAAVIILRSTNASYNMPTTQSALRLGVLKTGTGFPLPLQIFLDERAAAIYKRLRTI